MARTITINLTDWEQKIMEDMVMDIEDWFMRGPFKEKVANHEMRLAKQVQEKLTKEGAKTVPTDKIELCKMKFADPDYKNRKQREEMFHMEQILKEKEKK